METTSTSEASVNSFYLCFRPIFFLKIFVSDNELPVLPSSLPSSSLSDEFRGLNFMCVFSFELWWMTQRMGSCGSDIPFETQFLIVESRDDSDKANLDSDNRNTLYTIFLPIIEGEFRSVLQGNEHDELEICMESGCPNVEGFEGTHLVYVVARSDPFDVITNAVKSVERHLQTFSHHDRKKVSGSKKARSSSGHMRKLHG